LEERREEEERMKHLRGLYPLLSADEMEDLEDDPLIKAIPNERIETT
jgi:hypothetical protein